MRNDERALEGPFSLVDTIRITLLPADLSFVAEPGEVLLSAGLKAGMPMRRSCRNGTCRTCRCRVRAGTARHLIEWPGLSAEEKAAGWILPCVATAQEDLVLELPDEI